MNKFWLYLKKPLVTFVLVLTIVSTSLFSGCFDSDEDGDDVSVSDLLYGIRISYQKQSIDKDNNYVSVPDETFVKDLITQYLNISVEVLVSLASEYGKGVSDFTAVKNNLPAEFGEVTITDIRYCEQKSSDDETYCKISAEEGPWEWGRELSASLSDNKYASDFCNGENLFKMQVALYLINMGMDCTANGFGDYSSYFTKSPSREEIENLANDYRISHSGLLGGRDYQQEDETEQELLAEFICNNVIGMAYADTYREAIKTMITEIFEQSVGQGLNGEISYKYPVVASISVKDLNIKDIAPESEKVDEDDEEYEENSDDFFTLRLGQQFYKSLVFMPKTEFKFNGVYLIFESTEDVELTVYARLHEANSSDMYFDSKIADIHISPGAYDDIEEEDSAELEFDINSLIEEAFGMSGQYVMGQYNQQTDVSCYGGDKYGRALAISNEGEDVTLANLYKIQKLSKDSRGLVHFDKPDSCYLELVFETVGNKPFNIGFVAFDYDE